jgi:glyoxylase-like metal-dependent hydrolase (beta-lactamase superfamily II)
LHFTSDDIIDNRLQSIGLTPEDIDYVVLSHLHEDHCGNIHKFKNAEILVQKDEFVGTIVNYGLCTPKLMPPEYVQTWVAHKPKWRLIEALETPIVPGVTARAFGRGHNFGMLMLRVETEENGVLFLVQDLIYSKELLNKRKLPGIVLDEEGYFRAIEQIKELAAAENATIWFGHDIEQFNTQVHAPDGYYR